MMGPRPGWRRAGFTVAELLVAMMVLSVGILGLSATAGVVAALMKRSHLETQVMTRAQAEMERLLAGRTDTLAAGDSLRGGPNVAWYVSGEELKEVRLVVQHRVGGIEVADTLVTLVYER
jgi:prepilin-type N-terminal cleavage/methylation domain-containing protein